MYLRHIHPYYNQQNQQWYQGDQYQSAKQQLYQPRQQYQQFDPTNKPNYHYNRNQKHHQYHSSNRQRDQSNTQHNQQNNNNNKNDYSYQQHHQSNSPHNHKNNNNNNKNHYSNQQSNNNNEKNHHTNNRNNYMRNKYNGCKTLEKIIKRVRNQRQCWRPYNSGKNTNFYFTTTFEAGEFREYFKVDYLNLGFNKDPKINIHPPRIRVPTFVKYYLIIPHIRILYILIMYKC